MIQKIHLILLFTFVNFSTAISQWQRDDNYTTGLTFDLSESLGVNMNDTLIYTYYLSPRTPNTYQKLKRELEISKYNVASTKVIHTNKHATEFQIILMDTTVHSRETLVKYIQNIRQIPVVHDQFGVAWSIENKDGSTIIPELNDFRQQIQSISDSILFNNGLYLRHCNYTAYAETVFEECINREYKMDSSIMILVECYYLSGKRDLVITTLKRGLEFNPNSVNCLYGMADAHRIIEKNNLIANEWLLKLLEVEPENIRVIIQLGVNYFELGDYINSKVYLEKARTLDPYNMTVAHYFGYLKEKGY